MQERTTLSLSLPPPPRYGNELGLSSTLPRPSPMETGMDGFKLGLGKILIPELGFGRV